MCPAHPLNQIHSLMLKVALIATNQVTCGYIKAERELMIVIKLLSTHVHILFHLLNILKCCIEAHSLYTRLVNTKLCSLMSISTRNGIT